MNEYSQTPAKKRIKTLRSLIPEVFDEGKSEAYYRAGHKTVADIAKERIRGAAIQIKKEVEDKRTKLGGRLDFDDKQAVGTPDWAFKILKLSDSNFKPWRKVVALDRLSEGNDRLKTSIASRMRDADVENEMMP
ncbi:MAG: hypothetical protein LBN29_08365 [Mediterranea sp.]|jgi:adenine-specific DNA-methyltransferase|nr:hypothetical protein [Mediterranea sp.]